MNFDFFLLQPCNVSSSPQAQISKQRRNADVYLAPELRDDPNSTRKGDYLPSCSLLIAFILGEPWLGQLSMQVFPDTPFCKSMRNHAVSETLASIQISKGKTLEGHGLGVMVREGDRRISECALDPQALGEAVTSSLRMKVQQYQRTPGKSLLVVSISVPFNTSSQFC